MAYKCNSCNVTSDEAKECCGTPMVEEQAEGGSDAPADAPADAPTEAPAEGGEAPKEGEDAPAA